MKLLARHFLDICEMICKQLLFVWHRSVFRTVDINLSQAFPSLVQYKSSNPKIQQAAPIFQTESLREMYFSNIPLHAAVSISYAVPSKLQYITYDTFMTPWSNRHIYTRKRGDESQAKISSLSNKHKSLHYGIWANLCYHALNRSSTCIIRPTQSTLLISCYLCY